MNIITYGEIQSITDHRKRVHKVDGNGTLERSSVYEVLVEYENQFEKGQKVLQWEPFTVVYQRDAKLLQEYFHSKSMNIEGILNEEVSHLANTKKTFDKNKNRK